MTIWNHHAYERGELLSKIHTPGNVEARMSRRYDGNIGQLNRWIDEVRAETGESIPYFDPDAASRGVDILMLFQDPSGAADGESGFISKHNNDPTARNYYEATEAAGVPYDRTLNWNVVPWWSTNNPAFPGRTVSKEAGRAAPYLAEFIQRLGSPPKVLILSGGDAQKAWDRVSRSIDPQLIDGITVLRCPHPSPLAYTKTNRSDGRTNREHIIETFSRAVELAS